MDTRYLVASVTTLSTSVVVMGLVERGLITLEDRIVALLPAEVTNGLHVLEGVDHTPGRPGRAYFPPAGSRLRHRGRTNRAGR